MPSLSSFLPTRETGEAALDEKRRDAAIAGLGIDVGEDDEEVGFVGVRDPELAAGQQPVVAVPDGSRRQRERVAARAGFGQGVRADDSGRQLRQVAGFCTLSLPHRSRRVDDERVLNVDEHANGGIDARQCLDRQHGMKEARAGAAERLGDLDAHDAEVEELVDQVRGIARLFVHLPDEGADLAVGELVHAVAEQSFIVR